MKTPAKPMQPILSRMAFAGHPIHPMLIHFPVAALLGLVASDAAFLYTGDPFWARVSVWLAGVGSTGGAIAGLIGFLDWVSVPRIRAMVSASCHAIFAVMMLSLATFNWLLRLDDPATPIWPVGLLVSLFTAGIIAVASALGGILVYEFGVGVGVEVEMKR